LKSLSTQQKGPNEGLDLLIRIILRIAISVKMRLSSAHNYWKKQKSLIFS